MGQLSRRSYSRVVRFGRRSSLAFRRFGHASSLFLDCCPSGGFRCWHSQKICFLLTGAKLLTVSHGVD